MRGEWTFTYRGKLKGMVPDVDLKNENAVAERDDKLARCRRAFPRAKEQYHKAAK